MRYPHRALIVMLMATWLGSAASARADEDVIATWGTQPVTASEIKDLMPPLSVAAREQAASDPRILKERVRSLIARKLVLDAALKQGWDQKPEVVAQIGRARRDIIIHDYLMSVAFPSPSFPTEQEVRIAYNLSHSEKFRTPVLYHLAQIFIVVPPDATEAVASAAKKKAVDLSQKARKPDTDFPALARAESDEKFSAERGGDLGWLSEKDIVKDILAAVKAVKGKGITEPVLTGGGWHVVEVSGTLPAYLPPFEVVHDQIVRTLRDEALNSYPAKALDAQPLSIDEKAAAKLFAATP
jgi:parvulin-like peptidyl-prolyl isomerase